LSTPKTQSKPCPPKFFDDSFHKFSSPSLGTNQQEACNVGDLSRRFSIDNISRASFYSQNNPTTTAVSAFNRFNTISENEFEEPTVFQKSLLSNEENALIAQRRLTQIIDRNKHTKPHLQSSYALEELPSNFESLLKEDGKENRESFKNVQPMAKRKFDDGPTKSPNVFKQPLKREKFNLASFKQTNC